MCLCVFYYNECGWSDDCDDDADDCGWARQSTRTVNGIIVSSRSILAAANWGAIINYLDFQPPQTQILRVCVPLLRTWYGGRSMRIVMVAIDNVTFKYHDESVIRRFKSAIATSRAHVNVWGCNPPPPTILFYWNHRTHTHTVYKFINNSAIHHPPQCGDEAFRIYLFSSILTHCYQFIYWQLLLLLL